MRQVLTVAAVAAVLAGGTPAAVQASGTSFRGGCGLVAVSDNTPFALVVPTGDGWFGVGYMLVVPTDAAGNPNGATATVTCTLTINGVTDPLFTFSEVGTAVVAVGVNLSPDRLFVTPPHSVVTLCTKVTQPSGTETVCTDATETTVLPGPVIDVLDLVKETVDPVVCTALRTAAPVVNALGQPDVVHVDPATGDLNVLDAARWPGTPSPQLGWDCPPYTTNAPLFVNAERVMTVTPTFD